MLFLSKGIEMTLKFGKKFMYVTSQPSDSSEINVFQSNVVRNNFHFKVYNVLY